MGDGHHAVQQEIVNMCHQHVLSSIEEGMTCTIKSLHYTLPHGHPCAAFAGSSTVNLQGLTVGFEHSCINTAAVTTADAANAVCQHKRAYEIQ